MSTTFVEVVVIDDVRTHPNADKLEVAQVGGTTVVVQKGTFAAGDKAIYFPPDIILPQAVGESLGVAKYLKRYEDQCRVAGCRLRGQPSYGFLTTLECAFATAGNLAADLLRVGTDVSCYFQAVKYEPPVRGVGGPNHTRGINPDAAPDHPAFHKYTDIENYRRYAAAIPEGLWVRVTEKIHGMNTRFGLINKGDGEFEFMAGSHKVNWKPHNAKGEMPIWWQMMSENVVKLLTHLCNELHSVIVFGEIYGPGVQDMDYGAGDDLGFRAFDISVDGRYLDLPITESQCWAFGVSTVPTLHTGPFIKALIDEYTYGPTQIAPPDSIRSKFKGREGIVFRPVTEQYSDIIGGRMILKSVSADYLDRKGAQDN